MKKNGSYQASKRFKIVFFFNTQFRLQIYSCDDLSLMLWIQSCLCYDHFEGFEISPLSILSSRSHTLILLDLSTGKIVWSGFSVSIFIHLVVTLSFMVWYHLHNIYIDR